VSLYFHPESGEMARAESDREVSLLLGATRAGSRGAIMSNDRLASSPEAAGWVAADWQEGGDGELILVDAKSGAALCYSDGSTVYAREWIDLETMEGS
jgi:hypothetical protein